VTRRAHRPARREPFAVIAALVVLAPPATRAAEGRWIGSAEIGFDSYMERYAVADEDTLSSVAEFRSRLRLGYAVGALGRNYALLEARGLVGGSSYEAGGHAVATRRFGPAGRHAIHVDAEAGRRGYREGSEYDFPNGYLRGYARGTLRWRASEAWLLKLDDRIEHVDYDERTEFDYDFTRNAVTGSVDVARDVAHTFTAGARVTTMSVPDSAQIEYWALTPLAEYRAYVDAHRRVQVAMGLERRLYPDDGTRSSFWALLAGASFEWAVHPRWSLELIDELEHYDYDVSSGAYSRYLRNLAELLVNFNSGDAQFGVGPTFGWLESRDSPQDEYREAGVKVAFEWMGGSGAWVSASYQPGWRDYMLYEDSPSPVLSNPDAIFSDYGYHRIDVFATVRLYRSLWLNAYADYQPEDHDREGDDATATVASLTITYSF
jgi:hypothetical protein